MLLRRTCQLSTEARAASAVCWAATTVRNASAVATDTSYRVRFTAACAWLCAAVAARDVGCPQTEVERLPGNEDSQPAVPNRAQIVRFHTIYARNDTLWKQQSVEGVSRGAIRLRQTIHPRQICGLRQPDP